MAQYRRGLADYIKDELVHHPKPVRLDSLIELYYQLDNRIQERRQEKKGFSPYAGNRNDKKHEKKQRHRDPIEIDQVKKSHGKSKKDSKRKPLTDQQKKWLAEKACINCGQ